LITLRKADDVEEVDAILRDPELFARIAEDGQDDDYETPFDGHQCYLMIVKDDEAVGVWNLYPVNTVTLNIHCNLLKKHRGLGVEASVLILEWFLTECPKQYEKLNAEIPVIYPEVYFHTKKFGFVDEGINRQSIKKHGVLVDQWRLGATKGEIKEFLGAVN
jgi:RimJ/RimL family protein N-acetyltransferase